MSSTFRELSGLIECVLHNLISPLLATKSVRFCLDSKPAIANLVKGGGPVRELSRAVKKAWGAFELLRITPSFQWVRRNALEMQVVD